MRINEVAFFDHLAGVMNANPERYELLGDANMDMALVMRGENGDTFRVMLGFRDVGCATVAPLEEGGETASDCWLEGDLAEWQAMFADIAAHGRAEGEWTLNTLTIMGERLVLHADDPMGWDKFHRFNQSLQEFFDAAGPILSQEVADAGT